MSRKLDKSTVGLFEVEFGRKIRVVSAPKMWAWEIPGDEKSGWSTSWPVVGNGSQPYPQSHPPHMFKSQIRHNHIWKFQICDDMATSLCKGLGFISVRKDTQNLSSYLREIWGTLWVRQPERSNSLVINMIICFCVTWKRLGHDDHLFETIHLPDFHKRVQVDSQDLSWWRYLTSSPPDVSQPPKSPRWRGRGNFALRSESLVTAHPIRQPLGSICVMTNEECSILTHKQYYSTSSIWCHDQQGAQYSVAHCGVFDGCGPRNAPVWR